MANVQCPTGDPQYWFTVFALTDAARNDGQYSNPDLDADMVATAVNESPTSSTSTFKRKMRIVDVQRVDNIASQDELQAAADRARNESMLAARTITFQTLNEPGHGVGDIISIDDPELAGIYEETGWSLTMAAGQMMQHTAKRTVIA